MNRRSFLITCSSAPLILVPTLSVGNPLLYTALRFVFVTIATAIITKFTYNEVEKWIKANDLGLRDTSVMEVSEKVARQVKDYACEAIFLKRNSNNAINIQNAGSGPVHTNVGIHLEDINSGTHEMEAGYYIGLELPGDYTTAPIGELPYTGVKKIIGTSLDADIARFESPNILVADEHEVKLYGQSTASF